MTADALLLYVLPYCPTYLLLATCRTTTRPDTNPQHCAQVEALESLSQALSIEVRELKRERERALESRTLWGHAKNIAGYGMSAYCVFRCADAV